MGELFGALVMAAAVAGIFAWRQRATRAAAVLHEQGRIRHLRSAAFPSTCSWCRNTGLARTLFAFEQVEGGWHARDIASLLHAVPDAHVAALSQIAFGEGTPRWKRFCTERCTKEFLASVRVESAAVFHTCEYCGLRFPAAVTRCTNCDAPRR
jgi:hypothetical protein